MIPSHSRFLLPTCSLALFAIFQPTLGCRTISAQRDQSSASAATSKGAMSPTQPVCAGRFTLHLPSPFDGGFTAQSFNSVDLTWRPLHLPEDPPESDAWKSHVTHLRTELGAEFAKTRIVKEYMLDGRHAVFYQFAPVADSSHTLEIWTPYGDQLLVGEFDGARSNLKEIEQIILGVLHGFVPSSDKQPLGSAFCIKGGAIHLAPDQGEQIVGSWNLPANYQFEIRTAVVSNPPANKLISKAREETAKAQGIPGLHSVLTRAGNRTILGMEGQETIQHYRTDPDPGEIYNAVFAFAGITDKGSKPGLQFHLSAYDRPGEKVDPALFTATWDSILQTIEVRLKD